MKRTIGIYTIVLGILFSLHSSTQAIEAKAEVVSTENTLKPIMQKIGPLFAQLGKQINDPQMILSSTQLTQELFSLFQTCIPILPEKVNALPEPEKNTRKVEYQGLILNLLVELNHLEKTLIDDSRDAQVRVSEARHIFLRINDLRQTGHQIFR